MGNTIYTFKTPLVIMASPAASKAESSTPPCSASSLSVPIRRGGPSKLWYAVGAFAAIALAAFAVWPSWEDTGCPYLPTGSTLSLWLAQIGLLKNPHAPSEQYASAGAAAPAETFDEYGLRLYTRKELKRYDGSDPSLPILIGMAGDVFDVTEKGSVYYAKGGSYNVFAGKDSTRALALGSLEPADIGSTDISHFTEAQMNAVKEQHDFYLGKYPRVGRLKPRKGASPAGPPREVPSPPSPSGAPST